MAAVSADQATQRGHGNRRSLRCRLAVGCSVIGVLVSTSAFVQLPGNWVRVWFAAADEAVRLGGEWWEQAGRQAISSATVLFAVRTEISGVKNVSLQC